MFALTFLAGVGLGRLWPLGHVLRSYAPITNGLGFALLGCGVLLSATAMASLARARTTILPHRHPGHLVVAGPYRISRNPMYIGVILTFLGLAGLTQLLWPAILLPLPVLWLDRLVIPFEELRLQAAFGPEFGAYRRRVRRWL